MNTLQLGFARHDITPPLGVTLAGNFEIRYAIETLDPLEATALAASDGTNTVLLLTLDLLYLPRPFVQTIKASITQATGIPASSIYIHCTHTHNGPTVSDKARPIDPPTKAYLDTLPAKLAAVCVAAIADRKPARMGWTVGKAPNVAFIRRFRMKDGSVRSNPGINNPDILEPLGEIDDRVNILRFDREGGKTVVVGNFGNHPCVVNGPRISADWPGMMRRTVEAALPECLCAFFNGAQGDVNHVNVHPGECDRFLNYEPDECYKEIRHSFALYMGRAMAGTVLQEYDKVKYIDVDCVRGIVKTVQVDTNMPKPEDLPEAHRICKMLDENRIEELRAAYPGMMFETVSGASRRMVSLENGPAYDDMDLTVVSIGKVAFVGFPGEPFTGFGVGVKQAPNWEMILPTCCTGGAHGYFPMMEHYQQGGYEAGSSRFKPGTLEKLIEESKQILAEIAQA